MYCEEKEIDKMVGEQPLFIGFLRVSTELWCGVTAYYCWFATGHMTTGCYLARFVALRK